MAKLSRGEYDDRIKEVAIDAAHAYRKYVSKNSELKPDDADEERFFNSVRSFLMDRYPYDTVSNSDIEDLSNFSSDDIWKWYAYRNEGDMYDPRRKHEAAELAKYLPFLKGVAPEGEDWYSRGDLKLKGTELGFDYSGEGLGKFLDRLAKYQTVYDRGEIMKELRDHPLYWPYRIAYPSMMEAAENAISTGSDLSKAKLRGLGALDAAVNGAIFGIPGGAARGALASHPFAAGVLDAVAQGGVEGARQVGKTFVDPSLENDPAQALAAASFGATRPALVGSLQAAVARIPGKGPMAFSRGIGKATRAGNPAANERDAVKAMVENRNALLENSNRILGPSSGGILVNRSVADTEKMLSMKRVEDMAELLGVTPKKSGRIDVDEFMKAYDKKPVYTWDITRDAARLTEPVKGYPSAKELFQLTPENSVKYKALFPAKYADEAEASKARAAGLVLGKAAADFGGRFEPAFKLNPFNAGPQTFPEYTKQDWYTRLGPKARAIIDEAFKRKAEEEAVADMDSSMGL